MLSLGSLGGGVRYAFSSRQGGTSRSPYDSLNLSFDVGDAADAVAANRRLVLERLRIVDAVWLHAQHGDEVATVDRPVDRSPRADALVTTTAGLALAGLSADCALVVLADPDAGVLGVLHCGRPGLVRGTIAAAVSALHDAGARRIRAAMGPAVCGACYEVPAEMAQEVAAVVPDAAARSRAGRPALDIGAGVLAQLRECDVDPVRRVGGCTVEDAALFSYRRDGVTGRLGALVWRAA